MQFGRTHPALLTHYIHTKENSSRSNIAQYVVVALLLQPFLTSAPSNALSGYNCQREKSLFRYVIFKFISKNICLLLLLHRIVVHSRMCHIAYFAISLLLFHYFRTFNRLVAWREEPRPEQKHLDRVRIRSGLPMKTGEKYVDECTEKKNKRGILVPLAIGKAIIAIFYSKEKYALFCQLFFCCACSSVVSLPQALDLRFSFSFIFILSCVVFFLIVFFSCCCSFFSIWLLFLCFFVLCFLFFLLFCSVFWLLIIVWLKWIHMLPDVHKLNYPLQCNYSGRIKMILTGTSLT